MIDFSDVMVPATIMFTFLFVPSLCQLLLRRKVSKLPLIRYVIGILLLLWMEDYWLSTGGMSWLEFLLGIAAGILFYHLLLSKIHKIINENGVCEQGVVEDEVVEDEVVEDEVVEDEVVEDEVVEDEVVEDEVVEDEAD